MRIVLNGTTYELAPGSGVQREPILEFPEHIRSIGQQERSDRSLMSSWSPSKLTFGGGIERLDIDEPRDKESYWLSTVDTRWGGKVMLPPLVHVPTLEVTGYGTFNSLGFMYPDEANDFLLGSVVPTGSKGGFAKGYYRISDNKFVYSVHIPPDVTDIGTLNTLFRTAAYKQGKHWFYGANPTHTGIIRVDGLNATFSHVTRATGASPTHYRVGNFYEHIGSMHIAVKDYLLSKAFVHPIMSGTYEADTDAFLTEELTDATPYLAHTPDGLFVGVSDGVHLLNMTQRTFTEKLSLAHQRHAANCRWMSPFDFEHLMVAYHPYGGVGGLAAFNTVDNVIQRVGMDLDQGVPSGFSAEIEALEPSLDFLFAATKKTANISRVHVYDRYGWHFMASMPSQCDVKQLLMSGLVVPKLWMVPTGARNAPAFIAYPLENPLLTASYSFATIGDLMYPIFNAGMPEWKAGFFDMMIEADMLGSGRQIELFYGLDGATPTQSGGIATQSGKRSFQFGGGLGVEGYSFQPMLRFTRGPDDGESPVLITQHSPVLHYLKFPDRRETFTFTIDLAETKKGTRRPAKDTIDTLLAVATSNVLVPFFYGHVGTRNVKMLTMTSPGLSDDRIYMGDPTGQVEVVLAELL